MGIAQWVGWRWIFLLNLPVCIALAAAVCATIDESRDPHAKRIDAPGSVLFGSALAAGVLGAVLAARTHAALVRRVADAPDLLGALAPHFVSSLLAGDLAQATRGHPPQIGAALARLAPAGFASGFSVALCVSGAFALIAAVAVRLLVGATSKRAA